MPPRRIANRQPRIHFFADTAALAGRIAAAAKLDAVPVAVHHFPDGESGVRVQCNGEREVILIRSLHDPNAKLVETLLAGDALRRAGARRLTLVAPYLPYMRQDRVFMPGEPISQRVVGGLLGRTFDRLITVEAHLHRIHRLRDVVPNSARSLSIAPLLGSWLTDRGAGTLVVGPDAESRPWIRAVARRAGCPWIVADKQRHGDRRVLVHLPALPAARRAVLIDDIASSGATLAATARAMRRAGVRHIDAIVVHALMAPGARARLRRAGVRHLLSCDTIPHPSNALSVAPLLASAIGAGR